MAATTTKTTTTTKRLTIEKIKEVAELLYHGGITPNGANNPNKLAARILAGQEIGLTPVQSVTDIMVTNGKPCIYGDALPALILSSGLLESIEETDDGETATCVIKRKGLNAVFERSFSMADAENAELLGSNVWQKYPKRMRRFKAVNMCYRDAFADILKGIKVHEDEVENVGENNPASGPESQTAAPGIIAVTVVNRADIVEKMTEAANAVWPDAGKSEEHLNSPISDEQLAEMSATRSYLITQIMEGHPRLVDTCDDAMNATWKKYLKENYQVGKARELTVRQGNIVLEQCWEAQRIAETLLVKGDATLTEEVQAQEKEVTEKK